MNAERLLAHYTRIADAPDAVARLRRFVRTLAVRGKLAPQQANDEPVSRSLRRRKLAFCAEGAFDIPRTWAWVTVGAVADARLGKMLDRAKNKGVPRPYLRNLNVRWFDFDLTDMLEMRFEDDEIAEFSLKAGDVLICEGGEPGRAAVWDERSQGIFFQKAIHRVRFKELVLPGFFVQALKESADEGRLAESFTGTGIKHFTGRGLDAYSFPLPPVAEQRRIVAKVDELMALCNRVEAARADREAKRDPLTAASLARLNAPDPETFPADARFALDALPAIAARPDQIKALRQTILNLAVRGGLVRQDPRDEAAPARIAHKSPAQEGRLDCEIPSKWRWVSVESVADARLGKMLDKAKNKGRPCPYLRNTNVHWFDIRMDELKDILLDDSEFEEYRLKNGDVLICEGGHGIGRTAVWKGGLQTLVFQKALHRVRPGPHLHPDFFAQCCYVYFDNGIMQTYFTGVGIPHFTGRALAKLVFPLPPLAEQHRIVAKVDALMALCDQLETSLAAASDTRRRLLDALLAEALAPAGEREREAAE